MRNILFLFIFLIIGILFIYLMLPDVEFKKLQLVNIITENKLILNLIHTGIIGVIIFKFIPFIKNFSLFKITNKTNPHNKVFNNFIFMFCSIWSFVTAITTIVYISIIPIGKNNIYSIVYKNIDIIDYQFAISAIFTSYISLFFFCVLIYLKK